MNLVPFIGKREKYVENDMCGTFMESYEIFLLFFSDMLSSPPELWISDFLLTHKSWREGEIF